MLFSVSYFVATVVYIIIQINHFLARRDRSAVHLVTKGRWKNYVIKEGRLEKEFTAEAEFLAFPRRVDQGAAEGSAEVVRRSERTEVAQEGGVGGKPQDPKNEK